MKIAGIICEYNPFHLGHREQFDRIRRQLGPDVKIVCVMSGNFVQRGEPAVFDKFVRSRAAVECGADLVLELPLTKAISSAEGFCQGGVEVLERLGGVDYLCFGSETGDLEAIRETARLLASQELEAALKEQLKTGASYPSARQKALEQLGADAAAVQRPNDILAVEYCKALDRLKSPILPMAILRQGDYHAETWQGGAPSAAAVRARLSAKESILELVPEAAGALFARSPQYRYEAGERAMLARLRSLSGEAFASLPYGAEGLWSKLKTACRTESSVEAIIEKTKSKRYTYSRLKRMLLCGYLGVFQKQMDWPISYVRVLALSEDGRAIVRRSRKLGQLMLVNAGAPSPDEPYEALERQAADLYTLFAVEGENTRCCMERSGRVFCKGK